MPEVPVLPVVLSLLSPVLLSGCDALQSCLIDAVPLDYEAPGAGRGLTPKFGGDGVDARLEVQLVPVAEGLPSLTDIQFPPGESGRMLVTLKGGQLQAVDLQTGQARTVLTLDVPTRSELGLLGVAFHPRFPEDPRVFVNHSSETAAGPSTWIVAYTADPTTLELSDPVRLLEVRQPYANHDAGQLAFGPDGMLYVGLGDGGSGGDPKGNGQNAATMLGSMLRIDIDRQDEGKRYAVPPDNPFIGKPAPTPQTDGDVPPETWAIGLRNPWRYSFDPKGRLVVADVGQGTWEEVTILEAGDNAGWNTWEGNHCFQDKDCDGTGMKGAVWEYDHSVGASITGGYVFTSDAVPGLQGRYIVGDFVRGRIWALALPDRADGTAEALSLGQWPVLISTFGRDADGRVYVGDYQEGRVLRIDPAASGAEAAPAAGGGPQGG